MKAKDITHEYNNNYTILRYICKDGSVIKHKYMYYKLSECVKMFKSQYKDIM